MTIQSELTDILKSNGNGPFLFIGSGISRRYAQLEDWEGLLRKFCADIKDFEYYNSQSNSDLPKTASLIANDFSEIWWKTDKYASERDRFKTQVKYQSSALKISISEHVKLLSNIKYDEKTEYPDEIEELRKINIDGIITTNWDLLIETLFPEHKVYIGQEELIASTPQNIGEVYKIHGCCTKPNTVILTAEDYANFTRNNQYLAAKLVTIFVENPVIFLGYSLNDSNIKLLLSSIITGIGTANIEKIRRNLIFVQRAGANRKLGISSAIFSLGESDLRVTLITTDDFSEIYKSLQEVQHKIPVRILRRCKKQMYQLVRETTPSSRLSVIDFDQLDDSSLVDYVIGVGIQDRISPKGYQSISLIDIFKDVLRDKTEFEAESMLRSTIPALQHMSKFIPVYTYLKSLKINNIDEAAKYKLRSVEEFKKKDYRSRQYANFFRRECKGMTEQQLIEKYESTKAAILIPFIPWQNINCVILKEFLKKNIDQIDGRHSSYSTYFRKLICVYDAIVNNFHRDTISVS